MQPINIRHAIEKAGFTQVKIAKTCGVSSAQVHRVIHGSVSRHVREEIARVTGYSLTELWPEYYLRADIVAQSAA